MLMLGMEFGNLARGIWKKMSWKIVVSSRGSHGSIHLHICVSYQLLKDLSPH